MRFFFYLTTLMCNTNRGVNQADNQNCAFQGGKALTECLAKELCRLNQSPPAKTSSEGGAVATLSLQMPLSGNIKQGRRNELGGGCETAGGGVGDGWHACLRGLSVLLTTRSISDSQAPPTPSTTFLSAFGKLFLHILFFKVALEYRFYNLQTLCFHIGNSEQNRELRKH